MTQKQESRAVAVVMGSDSDLPQLESCLEFLRKMGVSYEARVLSAHRTPESCSQCADAASDHFGVIIAAAGGAAHLAGAIAGRTILPVIGIPLVASPLQGLDALLATVQMPPGVPVATVSIGSWGGTNAAILACQILALSDSELSGKLKAYKLEQQQRVAEKDAKIQSLGEEGSG